MNLRKGILCIIGSAFCFALMNVFVRLSGDLPVFQKSLFRNLIAVCVSGYTMYKTGGSFAILKQHRIDLLIRSLMGTIGLLANYYAVDHLLLADASMIQKLAPVFVIIASYWILHEVPTKVIMGYVGISLIGLLFIVRPSIGIMANKASLVGVLGALCAGIAYTYVRKLSLKHMEASAIIFYFSLFSCLFVLPMVIVGYKPMNSMQWMALLLAGLCASGGQYGVTYAYRFASGKQISIYDYSQVIFAGLMGFLLFHQIPDLFSFIGYGIILLSAIGMFQHNKKVH